MPIKSRENLFGAWAFLIGIIIAIAVGIFSFGKQLNSVFAGALLILGIIVGFVNVSEKDLNKFLMAAVSLVIVSFAGVESLTGITFLQFKIGSIVVSTMGALLVFLVPATIVVAIKSLFSISHH